MTAASSRLSLFSQVCTLKPLKKKTSAYGKLHLHLLLFCYTMCQQKPNPKHELIGLAAELALNPVGVGSSCKEMHAYRSWKQMILFIFILEN